MVYGMCADAVLQMCIILDEWLHYSITRESVWSESSSGRLRLLHLLVLHIVINIQLESGCHKICYERETVDTSGYTTLDLIIGYDKVRYTPLNNHKIEYWIT